MEQREPKRVKTAPAGNEMKSVGDLLAAIKRFKRPAAIVALKGTVRNVAAKHVYFRVPMSHQRMPDLGASDYLLELKWTSSPERRKGNLFPGLDNAMMNDWASNPACVDQLLEHPGILAIFKAIYGDDFRLVVERFCRQTKNKEKMADFGKTCHVDYPVFEKGDSSETPPMTPIPMAEGEILLIVIDQGKWHGIPKSGDAIGCFVGAMSPEQHEAYGRKTLAHLKSKNPLPARPQHWTDLHKLSTFPEITAAILLAGARPVLFPSKKPIAMPGSYNASRYKHFEGYFPPKVTQGLAAEAVLGRIRSKHGDAIAEPFEAAIRILAIDTCAKDPSLLSVDTLRRFVGA
jgi:hypothetical protein